MIRKEAEQKRRKWTAFVAVQLQRERERERERESEKNDENKEPLQVNDAKSGH